MKLLLTIVITLSTYTVFASDTKPKKAERFNERKSRILKHVAERMSALESHKSCVSAATDKDALKACVEKQKKSHKAYNAQRKMEREAKKKARAERKAKRKKSE